MIVVEQTFKNIDFVFGVDAINLPVMVQATVFTHVAPRCPQLREISRPGCHVRMGTCLSSTDSHHNHGGHQPILSNLRPGTGGVTVTASQHASAGYVCA